MGVSSSVSQSDAIDLTSDNGDIVFFERVSTVSQTYHSPTPTLELVGQPEMKNQDLEGTMELEHRHRFAQSESCPHRKPRQAVNTEVERVIFSPRDTHESAFNLSHTVLLAAP